MINITLIVQDNSVLSGITGASEIFMTANLLNPSGGRGGIFFDVRVASITGEPVTGFGNLCLKPHISIRDIDHTDFILIPGLMPVVASQLEASGELMDWLARQYSRGAVIGSVCTGAFLLAETGLLNGKTATTNWQFADWFRTRYPKIHLAADRLLAEEKGLITGGAATAYLDVCLHIVEKFSTPEVAVSCSKAMLIDPNRKFQAPYIMLSGRKHHNDADILEVQKWMEDHFWETVSIDTLAEKAAMSPRHFKRRFKSATGETPINYLQQVRIESAKRQLETTRKTVDEITFAVGYENSCSFRKLFKKYTTLTPSLYREKFSRMIHSAVI